MSAPQHCMVDIKNTSPFFQFVLFALIRFQHARLTRMAKLKLRVLSSGTAHRLPYFSGCWVLHALFVFILFCWSRFISVSFSLESLFCSVSPRDIFTDLFSLIEFSSVRFWFVEFTADELCYTRKSNKCIKSVFVLCFCMLMLCCMFF